MNFSYQLWYWDNGSRWVVWLNGVPVAERESWTAAALALSTILFRLALQSDDPVGIEPCRLGTLLEKRLQLHTELTQAAHTPDAEEQLRQAEEEIGPLPENLAVPAVPLAMLVAEVSSIVQEKRHSKRRSQQEIGHRILHTLGRCVG